MIQNFWKQKPEFNCLGLYLSNRVELNFEFWEAEPSCHTLKSFGLLYGQTEHRCPSGYF